MYLAEDDTISPAPGAEWNGTAWLVPPGPNSIWNGTAFVEAEEALGPRRDRNRKRGLEWAFPARKTHG